MLHSKLLKKKKKNTLKFLMQVKNLPDNITVVIYHFFALFPKCSCTSCAYYLHNLVIVLVVCMFQSSF